MSRVLIIDDSEETCSVIADILSGEGYDVSSAAEGATGLAQAIATHPDLILCDIIMPGISGYEVLSTLRREPSTAVTPVIFLTGVGGPEAVRVGMNSGADDYLIKPVLPADLIATVAARLERSAAVRREAESSLLELTEELAGSLLPDQFLTPLTAVMGLASLLMEEGAIQSGDIKEVGRGILEAGQALQELIERFLAYAELQAAMPDVALVLQGDKAFETAREEAKGRALRVHRSDDLQISGVPTQVPMALDHWRSLIRELVDNALKFSRAGSPIALDLTSSNGEPTLTVRDHGQGLPAEYLGGLAHRAPLLRRSPDQAGLGLGLSVVRRLLQLYAGTLSFETSGGKGTTARVRFHPPQAKPSTS
ncbi:MAG TPA: response regulator [Vicinamibacteria bacterium]|jgi:two-component system sensor histidine kinase/response regulator|nr:response regulator [Vicinamibacteria bacterium]